MHVFNSGHTVTLQDGTIFFSAQKSMTVLLITHKSKPSLFQASESFSFLICADGSLDFCLCSPFWRFFFTVVTGTLQYFAVLSFAWKLAKLNFSLFSADSCLHKRLKGFYTYCFPILTSNSLTLLSTGSLFFCVQLITGLKSKSRTYLTRQSTQK
jgi:hypothetical protein